MKLKKKKAFTLTELLVVVVVIGVLSAVTLPKFSKVIETRKTTEAEDLMSAVRTEQEKRCSLDKPYLTDINDLKDILPTRTTKNYDYSLTSDGLGILASSKGKYNYTLSMPSYKDGRLCCEGAECSKLNKDYPLCDDLRGSADFATGSECSAGITDPPPTEPENTCPPEDRPTETTRPCPSGCGEQTSVVSCVDGEWQVSWTGSCEEKPDTETATCSPCGETRTKTYTCENDEWVGKWDKEADECKTQCNICDSLKSTQPNYCSRRGKVWAKYTQYATEESECCCWESCEETKDDGTPCGQCTGFYWQEEYGFKGAYKVIPSDRYNLPTTFLSYNNGVFPNEHCLSSSVCDPEINCQPEVLGSPISESDLCPENVSEGSSCKSEGATCYMKNSFSSTYTFAGMYSCDSVAINYTREEDHLGFTASTETADFLERNDPVQCSADPKYASAAEVELVYENRSDICTSTDLHGGCTGAIFGYLTTETKKVSCASLPDIQMGSMKTMKCVPY